MKIDLMRTKLDPATTRVFVKGVEITELIESFEVESITDFYEHSTLGKVDKRMPINQKITMTLDMKVGNIVASNDKNEIIVYIGEYPTDEFLAEMVRLKLRREGILDEGGD